MNTNENKRKLDIPFITYILLCVGVVALDICTGGQNEYIGYLKTATVVVAILYFIFATIMLVIVAKSYIIKWFKNWMPVILVIIITLVIPVGVHIIFYQGQVIEESTFLTAFATYLTFVGAFSLGYFLYKREKIRRYEELKKKARLLYETVLYIGLNLKDIDSYIERGETYQMVESWHSDYLDIKHLVKYEEAALHSELRFFFGRIDAINKAIKTGDKDRAKRLCLSFEQKEQFSPSEYNYIEAEEVLLDISLDVPQRKPWKIKEREQIDKYADQFFDVVNLWVYNYLIKQGLTSCDADVIEYDLVEWLLSSPELRAWVEHPFDNRKITAVIFKISLSMNKKSKFLNYYWGMYSLKEQIT